MSGLHILKVIIPVSLSAADQLKRCKLAASRRIQLGKHNSALPVHHPVFQCFVFQQAVNFIF